MVSIKQCDKIGVRLLLYRNFITNVELITMQVSAKLRYDRAGKLLRHISLSPDS